MVARLYLLVPLYQPSIGTGSHAVGPKYRAPYSRPQSFFSVDPIVKADQGVLA